MLGTPWAVYSRRALSLIVITLTCLTCSLWRCSSFTVFKSAFLPRWATTTIRLWDQIPTVESDDAALWNWNMSGSFGSLLMQMQKQEEAMLAANETVSTDALLQKQAVPLDPVQPSKKAPNPPSSRPWPEKPPVATPRTVVTPTYNTAAPNTVRKSSSPPATISKESIDWDAVRELDDSVTLLTGPKDAFRAQVEVLAMPPLYKAIPATSSDPLETDQPVSELPLSRPEHYRGRIGRDLRHLALSIAASTDSVEQWKLFCEQGGGSGLFPLLETVREGARSIMQADDKAPQSASRHNTHSAWSVGTGWLDHREETFQAACTACRVIRDVSAISPELAAVVTDGILRANAAWNGQLMVDFCTMLEHANGFLSEFQKNKKEAAFLLWRRDRREARLRCKLYTNQLLLAMAVASDDAVTAIRSTPGLTKAVLDCSSYASKERRRRWLRYPGEMVKWLWRSRREKKTESLRRPFLEAGAVTNDLSGQVQRTANQILAAIGHNQWIPKSPGQKGLRILALDGGGARGMTSVTAVRCITEAVGGIEIADAFDMVIGTSTGGIIAFLTGLLQETSAEAVERYNQLIKQIFVKSALSTPLMFFTTATYDESPFMGILSSILGDDIMLDSRADPAVPYIFCVTSKMSSTPTHIALFRNYNYAAGELADPFTINPNDARDHLGLPIALEHEVIRGSSYVRKEVSRGAPGVKTSAGSRHPGSFRVLQRYALRASTAAPTFFKPVMMGGEMYCDGGIVASNPTAVAIHEARTLFPDIPIELVVSIGTGGFLEHKAAPRIGWDGIIGQIVDSATDGEQIHHILEDILGDSAVLGQKKSAVSKTRYFRFNPIIGLPHEFPIDVTDPAKLAQLRQITRDYMNSPAQRAKLDEISSILGGRKRREKQSDASKT